MKGIKFSPIDSIGDIKESFDFLRNSVFQACATEFSFSLPMHEVYQTMMQNLEEKYPIQFCAEYEKQIVGCIIAARIDSHQLFLPVIAVNPKFRGKGVAKQLLSSLTKNARKLGLKTYTVDGLTISPEFFIKQGFTPYVYIKAVAPSTLADIKLANTNDLKLVAQFPFDNTIKFAIPSIDKAWLEPFITNLKDFQAKFTYEKNI